MRRKLIPFLTVFALLLVAAGGATAAGDAGTNITAGDSSDDGGDVGICLVGADSPCNDAPADGNDTDANDSEQIGDDTDAEDGRMGIPEDQDGDGEIDERFRGNDSDAGAEPDSDDAGICLVGADSPCNDAANGSDAGNGTEVTHPTPTEDNQIWIPEDQNRDGEIDDRFVGTFGQVVSDLVPLFDAF